MAEEYVVADIVAALEKRQFPTITTWNRLEGRPRRPDFARALKAEVRDAMFMLSKQWQMGEFQGDDAGSPATVKVQLATTRLQTYQAARGTTRAFDESMPLEARVERRPLPLTMSNNPMSLDIRLLMGRQWLKMVKPIADYTDAFVEKYPIKAPNPTAEEDAYICAHQEVFQLAAAVAGRRMDGAALFAYLTGGTGRHAWDDIPSILGMHHGAIDDVAGAFVQWFMTAFTQPPKDEDAWVSDRLEYKFACAAPEGATETVFEAEEYYHGRLDWYNLNVDRSRHTLGTPSNPAPHPQNEQVQSLIPVPISYDGMPNTRWWAFEDRRINFGQVTPATTDLGKLMFLEFGLVYANDWFLIPLTLDAGSLARVRGMAVTNVFGERFWIAAAGADDAWQRWSMFTLSVKGNGPGQQADTNLLLLPTVPKIQEGRPLEEVLLVRDEVANMVWGVEKTIPLPTGHGKPGDEAAGETLAYHQRLLDEWLQVNTTASTAPVSGASIIYKVMSSVPENWIPFIPVHVPGDNRATQLQRAAMPRLLDGDPNPIPDKVRPRTMLLRDGLEATPKAAFFLHEEEVPRAGAVVSQAYQRTRWTDGRVIVWLGARKQTGRGQGSSGLAFDRIVNAPTGQG
ncbi:hypothetical protein [Nitrospira defluvii]|uniref:Uncharacterized protein n=1 Tax=Nitrospira defluvii TaxID=330214 RepID=A0ABM8S8H8_9BACT|nr:hypothetical protein [Nitrospira defluvii]CAE6794478.1 conserved hypothetical protein [Nitrospira defluvii]